MSLGQVIGDLLPLALGVAISPVPVIAVILMLLAPKATVASVAFGIGWVVGMTVVVVAVTLAVDPADDAESGDPSTWSSVLKIVLGLAGVLLAVKEWRARPDSDTVPELPSWMAAVDTMTGPRALALGAALSALNPKNLTLCLAAGLTIGAGGLAGGEVTIAVVVFVVIAASTVVLPVLAYLVAHARVQGPLDEMRDWLTLNNATVMAVLLLVIGASLIGKGVGGL
jgi:threonine/homoserine/homoserine lactone efflux protein